MSPTLHRGNVQSTRRTPPYFCHQSLGPVVGKGTAGSRLANLSRSCAPMGSEAALFKLRVIFMPVLRLFAGLACCSFPLLCAALVPDWGTPRDEEALDCTVGPADTGSISCPRHCNESTEAMRFVVTGRSFSPQTIARFLTGMGLAPGRGPQAYPTLE